LQITAGLLTGHAGLNWYLSLMKVSSVSLDLYFLLTAKIKFIRILLVDTVR